MVGNCVYIVISDTEYGTWSSAYSTYDKAVNFLQGLLDEDDDIQCAAESAGIKHLTAQAYLDCAITDQIVGSYYYIQDVIIQ